MPKYQYMGLIKLKYLEYQKLSKFFFQINNKKINFTNFINLAIKNNKVKFEVIFTKKKWFEIDTYKDIKFTKKEIW